ncbi:basal-body rod modification protein FlgD [Geothrix limicola]|uniref:Basal-body rod modification protein FlgD n=1 Tax=Geothrix limicola TaxID=2927978 RepID=A0ABQ5QHJ9_9BACT|nr:FlgD immunoglobulin-like domain containing protein [Geothrix limicola]GLH73811.1 basal-body rod modification protein FlgD [Geothrix limicola]
METGMIGATNSATSAATSGTKTGPSNTIDKDGFLQLLVAQLKNQDPTSSSQDPNAMVQQLTSFSSLEQAQQTNTLLQGLQSQNTGIFQAQAASMIGKKVEVDGSGFNLQSGQASMNIYLNSAANVTFTVKDAKGNIVATLPQGNLNSGKATVNWDGKDSSGNQLPDGAYAVSVTATGPDGKTAVPFQTSLIVKVDSVAFSSSGAISVLSGTNTFPLSKVLGVSA